VICLEFLDNKIQHIGLMLIPKTQGQKLPHFFSVAQFARYLHIIIAYTLNAH